LAPGSAAALSRYDLASVDAGAAVAAGAGAGAVAFSAVGLDSGVDEHEIKVNDVRTINNGRIDSD